jgi:hypothetical protein
MDLVHFEYLKGNVAPALAANAGVDTGVAILFQQECWFWPRRTAAMVEPEADRILPERQHLFRNVVERPTST